MYPNQKIQGPFGDVYTVNSPYLDKLADRAYKEEQAQKIQQARDAKAMDDGFSKELANVKAVDVPEIVSLYNNYKAASKGLIKKGANATTQDNQDLLLKKADLYKGIRASVEHKDFLKNQSQALNSDKKGLYADDAAQQLTTMLNTPTSKIDRSKDGGLFYQYSVPDLDKDLKIARGNPQEKVIVVGQSKTDPYKDDKEVYKVQNHPNQFYNTLYEGLTKSNKGRNFVGIMDNKYSEEEKEALANKYIEKIHDPKFIQIYGKIEPFPDAAMQTKVGQAAALKTMEEVVNMDLKPARIISETNTERMDKLRMDNKKKAFDAANREWDRRQPIKLRNLKEMLATRQAYKDASEEKVVKDVSAFVDGEIEDAVKNPVPLVGHSSAKAGVSQKITPYRVRTTPITLDAFAQKDEAGNNYKPKEIYYNPTDKTFILKGGEINGSDREITRDEYEAALTSKLFNTKIKLNQINTERSVSGDKKTIKSGSSSTVKKEKISW